MNFTISVPPGTTNHGDPRLICQPPQWSDYVIFYFGNYLAHAATVRSPPGETWKGVAWSAATALFLPFTGLFQGVQHLLHFPASKSREQALRKAAASGAICTVVKMRKRNPKSDDSQDAESQATVPDGQEPDWWPGRRTPRLSRWRKIQGITITPPGYEIVVVPKIFPLKLRCDKPDDISEEDWKKVVADLDLPCNYNVPKALISLVQAFWGIVTIYEARGNQIDMYGYAAFGLTVVPYAVMSITNLLAGLVRPEYPCMFLASSPDLVEASRCNGRFDCIVADINTNSAIVRKYNFRPPSYPLNPRNAIRIASRSLKAFHKSLKSRLSKQRSWSRLPTWILGHTLLSLILLLYVTPLAIIYGLCLCPVIVMGAMTRFKSQESTSTQRGWTLAWLLGSYVLPYFHLFMRRNFIKNRPRRVLYIRVLSLICYIPAVGGMLVIGWMIKDYGICDQIG